MSKTHRINLYLIKISFNKEYKWITVERKGFDGLVYIHKLTWGFGAGFHYYVDCLPF